MGPRIAIVSHSSGILELLSEVLADEGYHMLPVQYSREVCHQLAHYQPSLILLDVVPHRKQVTWDVFRILKRHLSTRTIPIILTTSGNPNALEVRTALTFKGVQVLQKPFDPETLLGMIRQMLSAYTQ